VVFGKNICGRAHVIYNISYGCRALTIRSYGCRAFIKTLCQLYGNILVERRSNRLTGNTLTHTFGYSHLKYSPDPPYPDYFEETTYAGQVYLANHSKLVRSSYKLALLLLIHQDSDNENLCYALGCKRECSQDHHKTNTVRETCSALIRAVMHTVNTLLLAKAAALATVQALVNLALVLLTYKKQQERPSLNDPVPN